MLSCASKKLISPVFQNTRTVFWLAFTVSTRLKWRIRSLCSWLLWETQWQTAAKSKEFLTWKVVSSTEKSRRGQARLPHSKMSTCSRWTRGKVGWTGGKKTSNWSWRSCVETLSYYGNSTLWIILSFSPSQGTQSTMKSNFMQIKRQSTLSCPMTVNGFTTSVSLITYKIITLRNKQKIS